MSKILILGGTGNISEPITRMLRNRGEEVILFNRGTRKLFEDILTITGDRDSLEDKQRAAASGPFDCVIDMIGFTPHHAYDDIAAFGGKTEQFIFCSTFNVFSQPVLGLPMSNEGERKPAKTFAYACDKAEMENIFRKAAEQDMFKLTIIRCSATYREDGLPLPIIGGHGNDGAMPTLSRILRGKPLVVPGDGTSVWSVTYHDDVAGAFAGAVKNKKAYNQSYTLCSDQSLTWEEYYRIAAKAWSAPEPDFIHVSSDLVYRCLPEKTFWLKEAFHYHCFFDTTKAKQDLGYQCTVSWEEGSRMQCIWHKKQNDICMVDDPEYEFFVSSYLKLEQEMENLCRNFRNSLS